jgi:hypothetical protein
MDKQQLAKDAILLVAPAIENLFKTGKRDLCHIVVMNPEYMPWEKDFEEAILLEYSFGDRSSWDLDFVGMAKAKAFQSWRHRIPNSVLQHTHPASLREDDLKFYGSFVYGDIVVACSGLEQHFDVLISSWVAIAMEQLAIHQRES